MDMSEGRVCVWENAVGEKGCRTEEDKGEKKMGQL